MCLPGSAILQRVTHYQHLERNASIWQCCAPALLHSLLSCQNPHLQASRQVLGSVSKWQAMLICEDALTDLERISEVMVLAKSFEENIINHLWITMWRTNSCFCNLVFPSPAPLLKPHSFFLKHFLEHYLLSYFIVPGFLQNNKIILASSHLKPRCV